MWGVLRGVYLHLDQLVYFTPFQGLDMDMKDSIYTGNTRAGLLLLFFYGEMCCQ